MMCNTNILTENGWVNVQNIINGMFIQGPNGLVKVLNIGTSKARTFVKVNNEIIVTTLQPFIGHNSSKCFFEERRDFPANSYYLFNIGTALAYFDGSFVPVTSVETIKTIESEEVFWIEVEGGMYYANGFLVGSWAPLNTQTYLQGYHKW